MDDPKQDTKEGALAAIGGLGAGGGTGDKSGGDDQPNAKPNAKSIVGGTDKDTPSDQAITCSDEEIKEAVAAAAAAVAHFTGGEQSNADITNVDVVKGGSPVAKKQKIVEATPAESKSKAAKCELGGRLCKGNLAGHTQKGGICNRCSKVDVCDGCVTECCGCKESICNKCRDGSGSNCHNILSYCVICKGYKCGKCGAEDFEFICEDDPTEGSVCCECVEKAKRGHFGRYHQGHESRREFPLSAKEAEAQGKCVCCGNVRDFYGKCDRCSESSYMCGNCTYGCNICDATICLKCLSYCDTCTRNFCIMCGGDEFDEGEDCSDCIGMY